MNDARIVEAILFASDAPLSPGEIARADESLDEDRVEAALAVLGAEYDAAGHAFELREVSDGVQLMTRPEVRALPRALRHGAAVVASVRTGPRGPGHRGLQAAHRPHRGRVRPRGQLDGVSYARCWIAN